MNFSIRIFNIYATNFDMFLFSSSNYFFSNYLPTSGDKTSEIWLIYRELLTFVSVYKIFINYFYYSFITVYKYKNIFSHTDLI